MSWIEYIKQRKDLFLLLASWVLVGALFPRMLAIVYACTTFILVLRTGDNTRILISLLVLLIFSDSRSSIFAFAEIAKIGVVVLTLIYTVFKKTRPNLKRNLIFSSFLPFIAYSVLATFWSTDPIVAFQKSVSYGSIFFIIPQLYLDGREQNRWIGHELVYTFTTILVLGILVYIINPSFASLVGRYRGLLGNPNGLGIFLTVMFAVFYPVYSSNKEALRKANFMYIFFGLMAVNIIMTGSRTALIAIIIFFIFNRVKYLSNVVSIIAFVALVASYEYLLSVLPGMILYLGLEDYFRLETLGEGSGRFLAWNFAWQRIQEVFFIGGGFGHTNYVFQLFQDELSRLGHQGNAHNSFLTLWLDTGLVGIILFTVGLVRSVVVGVKKSGYTLPIVFAVLFSSYFESWLAASLNPFTSLFLISLTMLIYPIQKFEERAGNQISTQ